MDNNIKPKDSGTIKASDFALLLLDLASTIHTEIDKVHLHYQDYHIEATCEDIHITIDLATPTSQPKGGEQ